MEQRNILVRSRAKSAKMIVSCAIAMIIISACSKNKETAIIGGNSIDCSGPAKTFALDVKPLLNAACGGCHGNGSNNGPGALTSYTEVSNAKASIRTAVVSGRMPQNSTLTAAQKNAIICWIDSGAPDN
jgi:hypothetical protein